MRNEDIIYLFIFWNQICLFTALSLCMYRVVVWWSKFGLVGGCLGIGRVVVEKVLMRNEEFLIGIKYAFHYHHCNKLSNE